MTYLRVLFSLLPLVVVGVVVGPNISTIGSLGVLILVGMICIVLAVAAATDSIVEAIKKSKQ